MLPGPPRPRLAGLGVLEGRTEHVGRVTKQLEEV